MTQNLTKTNVEGYSKDTNGTIVATNQQSLKAYKRQKQLFNSVDKIKILEDEIKNLYKEIDNIKRLILNGNSNN